MEVWVTGYNFESWPFKDYSCHVCFKLAYWFHDLSSFVLLNIVVLKTWNHVDQHFLGRILESILTSQRSLVSSNFILLEHANNLNLFVPTHLKGTFKDTPVISNVLEQEWKAWSLRAKTSVNLWKGCTFTKWKQQFVNNCWILILKHFGQVTDTNNDG